MRSATAPLPWTLPPVTGGIGSTGAASTGAAIPAFNWGGSSQPFGGSTGACKALQSAYLLPMSALCLVQRCVAISPMTLLAATSKGSRHQPLGLSLQRRIPCMHSLTACGGRGVRFCAYTCLHVAFGGRQGCCMHRCKLRQGLQQQCRQRMGPRQPLSRTLRLTAEKDRRTTMPQLSRSNLRHALPAPRTLTLSGVFQGDGVHADKELHTLRLTPEPDQTGRVC